MRLIFTVLTCLFFLSACAATGEDYRKPTARSGESAIVVYREPDIVTRPFEIDVDGAPACDLHSSGYFVVMGKVGSDVMISSSLWDHPGTSRLIVKVKPGKTYYVGISMNGKRWAGLLGLPGLLVAEGTSDKGGPFDLQLSSSEPSIVHSLKKDC